MDREETWFDEPRGRVTLSERPAHASADWVRLALLMALGLSAGVLAGIWLFV